MAVPSESTPLVLPKDPRRLPEPSLGTREKRAFPAEEGTDLSQTASNMINCFIGAGILTVPFAFRLAGFGALLGLIVVAILNWYTSILLGRALQKASESDPGIPLASWDMQALGRSAFGPWGEKAIGAIFALELWFALETFLVLTGVNVRLLTGIPATVVIIAAGILGTISLSLPMSVISRGSCLSVWCMFGGLAALIVCGCGQHWDNSAAHPSANTHKMLDLHALPSAFAIFMYCFSGLPCLPHIRSSMRQPSTEYAPAVHRAFIFAIFYYSAIGLLGYQFFAGLTKGSFTENLAPLPGQGHPSFYAGLALLSAGLFAGKLQAGFPLYAAPVLGATGFGPTGKRSSFEVWGARLVFAIVSIAFAVFAQDELDAVAELMGAFLTNFTSLIFPTAAYWAVCRQRGEKLSVLHVMVLSSLLLFGSVFGVVGTCSAWCRFWAEEAHGGAALTPF